MIKILEYIFVNACHPLFFVITNLSIIFLRNFTDNRKDFPSKVVVQYYTKNTTSLTMNCIDKKIIRWQY